MVNKLNKLKLYNNNDDFEYKKNKSDLVIKFNRIAFIFFVFFVILSCQKKSDESSNVVEKDSVVETHSTSNDEPNTEFYKELSLQGITFIVKAQGNQITLKPYHCIKSRIASSMSSNLKAQSSDRRRMVS